jgi:hypothetical protein
LNKVDGAAPQDKQRARLAADAAFLIFSASLLMAEILFARTARIALGYEYQLLVISLSISGLGFGGIPVYFLFRRVAKRINASRMFLAFVYAALLPVPFLTVNNLGIQYAAANTGVDLTYFGVTAATMVHFCLAVFAVYFAGGIIIAAFLRQNDRNVATAYSLNLLGSAAGALLIVPVLNLLGNEKSVVVVVLTALVAAFLFSWQVLKKRYLLGVLAALIIVATAALNHWAPVFTPGGLEIGTVASGSNSFSQVTVFPTGPYGEAKNLSQTYNTAVKPRTQGYNLVYDRKLKTNAVVYSKFSDTAYLKYDLFYFPYFLTKKPDAFLIGVGGGTDVVLARLADSRKITAVEMNPLMIELARKRLKTKAYDDPRVNLIIGEARTTLLRLGAKYDLIYLSNTGGFGGTVANSYYYPENYLHTREAYLTYFNHLKPGGILCVVSKNSVVKEYVGVGLAALAAQGRDAADRVALLDGKGLSVAIIKPTGFSPRDKRAILANAARLMFAVTFPTEPPSDTSYGQYMTDDKPFLGDKNALAIIRGQNANAADSAAVSEYNSLMTMGTATGGTAAASDNEDGFLPLRFLGSLSVAGVVAVALLMFAPLLFKRVRARGKTLTVLGLMGVFGLLGFGFMAFELVMLQRAFLFVGHPAYATAVVLTTFLLFSGLGSLASARISAPRFKIAAAIAGGGLFTLLAAGAYLLNTIFIGELGLAQPVRVLIFVCLLALPCFLSGVLFPIGLRATGLIADDLIPWVWSVNGLAIVTGSALGALGSYFFGFRTILGAGAACYLAAAVLFIWLRFPAAEVYKPRS